MSKERLEKVNTPEFEFEMVIDNPEWIDSNAHVNNAYHLVIYELARASFIEALGLSFEEIKEKHKLNTVLAGEYKGFFGKPLLLDDRITVVTTAHYASRSISFNQRIGRDGIPTGNTFQGAAYFTDSNGKPRSIPKKIIEQISKAEFMY